MIPKRDDCKSIEELIHLSLDGRLDSEGKRRLEKHLAACARCTEKLERFRAIEAGTRSIGLDEPPPEYWTTFSGRVIEKIETGTGRKPAWSPARAIAGFFGAPRPRLRLAAGVASLAIAVIAGALYLHNRGGVMPPMPARDEVGTVSQVAPTAEREAAPTVEPKTEAAEQSKSKPAAQSKAEPPSAVVAERAATSPLEPSTAPAGEGAQTDALASAKAPEEALAGKEQTPAAAESAGIVVAETSRDRAAVIAERSKEVAAIVDSMKRMTEAQHVSNMANAFSEKKGADAAMPLIKSGSVSAIREESYVLYGGTVPRVSAADTSMTEAVLLNVIHQWVLHIKRNPLDPENGEGYVQVANAYYLLARLTRDEAVISQGSWLVQEYADRVDDPELKKLLLDSKARIESFRGK